ncbi:putative membrane protein [Oikeobacillus pervagus]|uniref:Membrane protein n=1 Tax=Oikeobacillus pervagus TaxID=1325931 RepID=A0AAJ1WJ53_9BACI|nr:DUF2269 family protein [Oikeobacillus pervagus]MDQ0215340.1 putative membrane protein [Oikeobacillus pervagus]
MYRVLLYIHIVSAILSIGPFFVLLPLIRKLRIGKGNVQQAYLDSFRFVVRLSKHAGHVLVVSGVLLVFMSSWTWKTSWILMTVAIMVSSLYFLARAFSPTIRKFADPKHDQELLIRKLKRSLIMYIGLLLVMLWFMVTKPVFW